MTETFQHWGLTYDWAWFLATIIGILVIALPLLLAVAMIIYAERKIWAAMALRRGPNVVGPWGLLQSFADGLKVFLITVVLYAGTFNLSQIVVLQKGFGLGLFNGFGFNLLLFPMWVVFFISSMAETFRTPFDLVEAESELVAGHQTEYSSMSFALFWLGEYANVILMCALNAILFWGGWLPPVDWAPLYIVPGIIWLLAKMCFFFFCFGWVKATVPRYRYDQLMRLGWKIFLPLSLLFVVLVSGWLMLTRFA